jgi:DNA-binding CsgD family transcriptional regulator
MMLETELKITTDANLKLEKEIHSKEKDLKKIALDITKKNEILSTLKEEIQKLKQKPEQSLKYSDLQALNVLILDTLNIDNERNSLDKYLKELNNSFYQNLEKKYPELTENDKKLCSLLRLKLSSKEIASILNIIPKSVEVNRYRLRRKMGLEKNDKLIKILRKL